jgi:hypothetical protein
MGGKSMLKKFGLFVLTLSCCTLFAAALFAQVPTPAAITQADVDLYVKLSSTPDPVEKQKLMTEAGSDIVSISMNQGKIAALAAMLSQGMTEDAAKQTLNQNPQTSLSDDELALLVGQKDALVAAFKKSVGQ